MSRMLVAGAVLGLGVAISLLPWAAQPESNSAKDRSLSCDADVGIVAEPTDDCGQPQPCGSSESLGTAAIISENGGPEWVDCAETSTEAGQIAIAATTATEVGLDPADPLGVLAGRINNKQLYDRFVSVGLDLLAAPRGLDVPSIQESLASERVAELPRPTVPSGDPTFPYQRVAQSSLLLGTLYDCGKCDDMHGNVAGGVIISADGLCLTNHHVLERRGEDTRLLFAMDYAGRGYGIQEVLAVNRRADVALVRLAGPGPFVPCPLATAAPLPNETAYVLSHPSNEFFVLTQGIVSRHVTLTHRRGSSQWLEITAPFGAGSSGSGIFNERGELIGLVSRIQPIFRSPSQINAPEEGGEARPGRTPYAELILRRCVTLEAIQSCFSR